VLSLSRRRAIGGLVGLGYGCRLAAQQLLRYKIDTSRSRLRLITRAIGVGDVVCEMNAIYGEVHYDPVGLSGSSQVQIDTSSLRVIDFPLTWLARSREFLDTSRFPIASFVSSDLQFDGGVPTTITGALTIKGITRRKRFEVKKIELDQTTSETKARLSVEASRRLSRSHFDIRGLPGLVDDLVQVELLLSAQAVS